jgi:hypothetical protein
MTGLAPASSSVTGWRLGLFAFITVALATGLEPAFDFVRSEVPIQFDYASILKLW